MYSQFREIVVLYINCYDYFSGAREQHDIPQCVGVDRGPCAVGTTGGGQVGVGGIGVTGGGQVGVVALV